IELTRNGLPIVDQTEIAGNLSKSEASKQPAATAGQPVTVAPQAPAGNGSLAEQSVADAQAPQDKESPALANPDSSQTSEFDANDVAALTNKPEGSAAALGAAKRAAPAAPGIVPQRQLAEPMAAIAPSPAPPAEARVQIQLDPNRERFANAAANP
ncbi:VWA domain-containing protein, partial [Rhizobium leguminosarum]|nr:VWA domain-containing protein [Rhizobium leguminosarum]